MNRHNQIAPLVSFLDNEVFNHQSFAGQKSNLFDPESVNLKQQLNAILKKIVSSENLEFLSDLHALNSKTDITAYELQTELKVIEKKYISQDADMLLNIQQETLSKIRNKPFKSLLDYKDAIKEVFALINTNVIGSTPKLILEDQRIVAKAQRVVMNELATAINNELNGFIALPKKLPSLLKRLSNNDQDSILEKCQQDCKKAQKDLSDIQSNKLLTDMEAINKFDKVVMDIIGKLSSGFRDMQVLEKRNANLPKKSIYLEEVVDRINNLVRKSFKKENSSARRTRDSRSTESTLLKDSYNSESFSDSYSLSSRERNSESRTSVSDKSRSELPPIKISGSPYKPSSRTIDQIQEEDIESKTISRPKR